MNIETYKFIDLNSNGIVVEFDNKEESAYKISLFFNKNLTNTCVTSSCSHLFNVSQSGNYHIEIEPTDNEESKKKFISSNIYFNIKNEKEDKYHELNPAEIIKTNNKKIPNIDNYFLELKITKNKEDSIKKILH